MFKLEKAFTIVEMLVVVAIFLVITGIILVNAPQFRERVSIDLVSADLALVIRSAQTYGMATKQSSVSGLADPFPSYGFYLNLDQSSPSGALIYIYPITDLNNPSYDNNQQFEEEYKLASGFKVESVRIRKDGEPDQYLNELNIAFLRPELKATICDFGCGLNGDKAEIVIKSVKEDNRRMVAIYQNGQIAVEKIPEKYEE